MGSSGERMKQVWGVTDVGGCGVSDGGPRGQRMRFCGLSCRQSYGASQG